MLAVVLICGILLKFLRSHLEGISYLPVWCLHANFCPWIFMLCSRKALQCFLCSLNKFSRSSCFYVYETLQCLNFVGTFRLKKHGFMLRYLIKIPYDGSEVLLVICSKITSPFLERSQLKTLLFTSMTISS